MPAGRGVPSGMLVHCLVGRPHSLFSIINLLDSSVALKVHVVIQFKEDDRRFCTRDCFIYLTERLKS